jgi:hypothetical protein
VLASGKESVNQLRTQFSTSLVILAELLHRRHIVDAYTDDGDVLDMVLEARWLSTRIFGHVQ